MSSRLPPSEPEMVDRTSRLGRTKPTVGWARRFPGVQTLSHYQLAWLPQDLMAGLILTAVLVPVGIAYAFAAGVPASSGLYATIFGLLAYALFGPSRVLVLGPDSSLVALILGVVLPLSGGEAQRAVALAAMMALTSGTLCVLAGVARLGFITELLSKPIRYGYMNGIALTVLLSQLPTLFGLQTGGESWADASLALFAGLSRGHVNGVAVALGSSALAAIVLLRRSKRVPGAMLAIVGTTAVVAVLDLSTRASVAVLGSLPQGLPSLSIPMIQSGDIVPVLIGSLAVALVSFADTSVLSRTCAARAGKASDPNQEMFALGMANLAAGLFQGIPISASASRTPVAEAAGAETQLACAVGALAVAGLLVWAPKLLANLPEATLAAVVIASAMALFEVTDLRRIYGIQQWEFWLSLGCTAGVVLFGAIPGIGLAIAIAVIEFLWDGWRPHSAVLGRVDGVKGYHDITRYPNARLVPGLVLFRWDAPLFFANAELFRERVIDAVDGSSTPVRWLVVSAEPITSVDVTSADMLGELDKTLQDAGIELRFAEMKDPVKDKLKRFGLFAALGQQRFSATIGEAVNRYIETLAVSWVDWEDRKPQHETGGE